MRQCVRRTAQTGGMISDTTRETRQVCISVSDLIQGLGLS